MLVVYAFGFYDFTAKRCSNQAEQCVIRFPCPLLSCSKWNILLFAIDHVCRGGKYDYTQDTCAHVLKFENVGQIVWHFSHFVKVYFANLSRLRLYFFALGPLHDVTTGGRHNSSYFWSEGTVCNLFLFWNATKKDILWVWRFWWRIWALQTCQRAIAKLAAATEAATAAWRRGAQVYIFSVRWLRNVCLR